MFAAEKEVFAAGEKSDEELFAADRRSHLPRTRRLTGVRRSLSRRRRGGRPVGDARPRRASRRLLPWPWPLSSRPSPLPSLGLQLLSSSTTPLPPLSPSLPPSASAVEVATGAAAVAATIVVARGRCCRLACSSLSPVAVAARCCHCYVCDLRWRPPLRPLLLPSLWPQLLPPPLPWERSSSP